MKQLTTPEQFHQLSPHEQEALLIWKKRKYDALPVFTIGHLLEFLIGHSRNLHYEYADGRFYNHILINGESVVGWDGEELIDMLWYEATVALKHCLARSRFFADVVQ